MPGTLQTINVNRVPQRIETFMVQNDSYMLVNPDIVNAVFIGNDPGSQIISVPPLGSVTLGQTNHDTWISTNGANYIVNAYLMPNGSNWTPSPAQVAAQINALGLAKDTSVNNVNTTLGVPAQNPDLQTLGGTAGRSVAQDMLSSNKAVTREIAALLATGTIGGTPGGIPMLRYTNQLGAATGATLAGNAGATILTNAPVNQPGYEMLFQASIPAGAGTIPFANISFTWSDTATGLTIRTILYVISLANGPANLVQYYMTGPCFGNRLTVQIQNLEPAQTATYTWLINQTSHVHLVDNIIQPNYPTTAPITFAQPAGTPSSGILCLTHPTIGPSANADRLLGVYSGRAFLIVDNTGVSNGVTIGFHDPTGSIYGNLAAQIGNAIQVAAGAVYNGEIALPRGPILLRMRNQGTTGNITPGVTIISEDY